MSLWFQSDRIHPGREDLYGEAGSWQMRFPFMCRKKERKRERQRERDTERERQRETRK